MRTIEWKKCSFHRCLRVCRNISLTIHRYIIRQFFTESLRAYETIPGNSGCGHVKNNRMCRCRKAESYRIRTIRRRNSTRRSHRTRRIRSNNPYQIPLSHLPDIKTDRTDARKNVIDTNDTKSFFFGNLYYLVCTQLGRKRTSGASSIDYCIKVCFFCDFRCILRLDILCRLSTEKLQNSLRILPGQCCIKKHFCYFLCFLLRVILARKNLNKKRLKFFNLDFHSEIVSATPFPQHEGNRADEIGKDIERSFRDRGREYVERIRIGGGKYEEREFQKFPRKCHDQHENQRGDYGEGLRILLLLHVQKAQPENREYRADERVQKIVEPLVPDAHLDVIYAGKKLHEMEECYACDPKRNVPECHSRGSNAPNCISLIPYWSFPLRNSNWLEISHPGLPS